MSRMWPIKKTLFYSIAFVGVAHLCVSFVHIWSIFSTEKTIEDYKNQFRAQELLSLPSQPVSARSAVVNADLLEAVNKSPIRRQEASIIMNPPEMNITCISCIKKKEICRFDDIGDFLESSDINFRSIVHEPLQAIPAHRRIPHEKANDWQYILDQRARLPEDGSLTALMDYNAMLIPLYSNGDDGETKSKFDPVLLDRLTGRYHPYFSDSEADRVKYLSITRSSNLHSCKPKFKFHFGTLAQDFLGLSLLDENLKMIKGTDISVNVDKWLMGNMTAVFHDFQIIPVRSTKGNPLKDQLFLFPSGHIGTFSFPIDIRRVPPASELSKFDDIPWESKLKGDTVPVSREYQYGDGLQLRFIDNERQYDKWRPSGRGDRLFDTRGVDRGKNFHIFESSSGETYMETWPHGFYPNSSHVTVPIDFISSSYEPSSEMNLFPGGRVRGSKKLRYEVIFPRLLESRNKSPQRSFHNQAPKHERWKKAYRGTSQIIDMKLNGKPVKVGISHSVSEMNQNITDKRVYLSSFYAFSPEPPFETVALSGYFCFNHMKENDIGYSSQWISERPIHNRTAPIRVSNENYRCPVISFAAGLTEMIGYGGENVIITYGVNDCYSRSIIVPKRKIEMLLLGHKVDHWG